MPQIVNNLMGDNANNEGKAQPCTFDISNPSWLFSYKSCAAEDGILRNGGGYAFTLTFGNMGQCVDQSFILDTLSVNDIGGIQLRIMNISANFNRYIPYFIGLFYYPAGDYYLYWAFTLDGILENNLELVICPGMNMNILLYDYEDDTFYVSIDSNTIQSLGLLLQVEDIFCDAYPIFATLQESKQTTILTETDFKLKSKELDIKLKELKEKYSGNFKKIKW